MVLTVRAVLGGHGRRRRGRRGVPELLADPSLQLGAVVVVPTAVLRILKLIHCLCTGGLAVGTIREKFPQRI